MTGTTQNDTPELEPPEWLIDTPKKRIEWGKLDDKGKRSVLLRGDEIREEYGLNSPMMIIGALHLGA